MKKILLIGGGGHCRSCIDVIEQQGFYEIAGIVDRTGKESILGYQFLGTDAELPDLRKTYQYALITVGQINTPDIRMGLFKQLIKLDFELPVIVSPKAYVSSHTTIITGTVVMHHALVNAGARIGKNCIINSKALVEHDVVIEDHCHVATGAIVNGGARIGQGSFLGSASITVQSEFVEPFSFVRANSIRGK